MITIAESLRQARERLSTTSDTATLDAEVLLAHALGVDRSHLFAHPECELDEDPLRRFEELIDRRAAGEPVAYLTGHREFWSLDLEITPDVLIPRPETETLVTVALEHIPTHAPCDVADLGTGSGAVAIAIAHERPAARVLALERDPAALRVARRNVERLGLSNVELRLGDWCTALADERFDVIVANPPYVASDDPHLGEGDVRFEPRAALDGGPDGLDAIRRIVADAREHLKEGGWLALEHGPDQGISVPTMLDQHGYIGVATYRDLADLDRVTAGRYRNPSR